MQGLTISLASERVQLLAERALYWPARKRLLIADLHLGKGDVFRAAGIAVPTGGSRGDLQRLSALLMQTGAQELWVLGDFLHGPHAASADAAWRAFRALHCDIRIGVLRGNHDRALRPTQLGMDDLADGLRDGPFVFRHEPPVTAAMSDDGLAASSDSATGFALCGHVHPVLKLPGFTRALPVFQFTRGSCVLPAFSLFTGGYRVWPSDAAWLVACGADVVPIGPVPAVIEALIDTGAMA